MCLPGLGAHKGRPYNFLICSKRRPRRDMPPGFDVGATGRSPLVPKLNLGTILARKLGFPKATEAEIKFPIMAKPRIQLYFCSHVDTGYYQVELSAAALSVFR